MRSLHRKDLSAALGIEPRMVLLCVCVPLCCFQDNISINGLIAVRHTTIVNTLIVSHLIDKGQINMTTDRMTEKENVLVYTDREQTLASSLL